jgi:DNA-binding PadR family transcriptional regulator
MTGWDLARQAETLVGDFWNLSPSQIYRELRTLEQSGLVEAGPAGTRDKKPFSITERGRAAFSVWMRREPGPDIVRSPLLLMVFFAGHLDPTLRRRFLAIQRLRHEQTLDEYRRVYQTLGDDEPDLANVLRFAILHEEAYQKWFESLETEKENERNDAEVSRPPSPRPG